MPHIGFCPPLSDNKQHKHHINRPSIFSVEKISWAFFHIEKVAKENPEKIITKKINYKKDGPSDNEINEIISIFKFKKKQQEEARKLIKIEYFVKKNPWSKSLWLAISSKRSNFFREFLSLFSKKQQIIATKHIAKY